MANLVEFNPLKSIAVPNIPRMVQPRGLVVVIGPNSSGKTQMLKDIQGRVLGQPRKLVVCDEVELQHPSDYDQLVDVLCEGGYIRKRTDPNNNVYIDTLMPLLGGAQPNWSVHEPHIRNYYQNAITASPGG